MSLSMHFVSTPPIELATPRLVLRRLRADDVDDALAFLADADVAPYLPQVPQPVTRAAAAAFVARTMADPWDRLPTFAVERDRRMIGTVTLAIDPTVPRAMLGYALARTHRGQGLATEAAAAVVAWAFATLPLTDVWATARPDNLRSRRVLAKLGMTEVARTAYEVRYRLRAPAR